MRRILLFTAAVALLAPWQAGDADAGKLRNRRRLKRMDDTAADRQGLTIRVPDDAPPCDLGLDPDFPAPPVLDSLVYVLGDAFDPDIFAQISVAGDGRVLAYATPPLVADIPLGSSEIVLLPEGRASTRVTEAAGDDDQPCVRLDRFGLRLAWRGSEDVAGESNADIYIRGVRGDESKVKNVTQIVDGTQGTGTCADPALAARTRNIEMEGGFKTRQRDARLAFVSTADLDNFGRNLPADVDDPETGRLESGRNPLGLQQLFLWHEKLDRFFQITDVAEDGHEVRRPAISGSGDIIAFESTADLTPGAVNPNDSSQIGNPNGVRQIYRWKRRRGITQLTWGDRDSWAPKMDLAGRYVFFCTQSDLIVGGNPERNHEIFRWRAAGPRSRRLKQLTATTVGDSVLPRPTANGRKFTFYSTGFVRDANGDPQTQCLPLAYYWSRGKVSHVHGLSDADNLALVLADPDNPADPILTGPPVPGVSLTKIHFATNEPAIDPRSTRDADGNREPNEGDAALTAFHIARSTRYRPGSAVTEEDDVRRPGDTTPTPTDN